MYIRWCIAVVAPFPTVPPAWLPYSINHIYVVSHICDHKFDCVLAGFSILGKLDRCTVNPNPVLLSISQIYVDNHADLCS